MKFAVSFLLNVLILVIYLQLYHNILDFFNAAGIILYLVIGITIYNISYMYLHIFKLIKTKIKRKLYERKQTKK